MEKRACVVGSGPNGLAAAIVLARAGHSVQVFEAEAQPGGAVRSLELTLPGYLHDFGSAVYPMAAGSPFFGSLPLADFGLRWIHSPAPLAHPFDDGSAVVLERDWDEASRNLGVDGRAWRALIQPFVERWADFSSDVLRPVVSIPRHPLLMARFAKNAIRSARAVAEGAFSTARVRALFAGLAAHSFLALDEPFTAAFGMLLGAAAHAVGWPIAHGGAQSVTNALCAHLATLGGNIRTSCRVMDLRSLADYRPILLDVTPRQLLRIAGERFTVRYRRSLERYRYGPAAFKIDFALREPIPWRAEECRRAATIHVGGSLEEISRSETRVRHGDTPEHPFVIVVQPSLFDPSRSPAGKHTAWAYCHVPNGCAADLVSTLEAQIERFAPGFRECVTARRVLTPAALEQMNSNLIGGDISGGASDWRQIILRPGLTPYATSDPDLYICSSSTPPGGGVHGMCGFHAATLAVKRCGNRK